MTSKPIIEERPGTYSLRWPEGVQVNVTRTRAHPSDGRISGEIAVRFGENGATKLLHQASFNFTSTAARDKLTKTLASRADAVDWFAVLEQTCFNVVNWMRQGEPVVELWGDATAQRPEYLVEPLVVRGYPNIIFGDPGSFKSALATLLIAVVALPWRANPLGLRCPAAPVGSLFLDWETDKATVNWTLSRLFRGHGLAAFPVSYRRCAAPLPQDVDALRDAIAATKAELVVIDSLGMASGGDDLNRSGAAIGFYTALRQLNVTSLILAHNSKDRETKTRSIIGHQYYTAQARNIWEVRKVQDVGDDEIDLALFHRKPPPFAKLAAPMGAHVTFTADSMNVRAQGATTVREFVAEMGLSAQIREVLQNGAMTVDEIARETGGKYDSVRRVLYRMRDKRQAFQVEGGKWGLALEQ